MPETEGGELLELGEDPAGIDPPETRYTQEYQDFLASREADERNVAPAGEACADALAPVQAEFARLSADKAYLEDVMAKGAEVRKSDVVANYSLRDEIDFEKQQVNLFETIMPVNGNVNEFLINRQEEESTQ